MGLRMPTNHLGASSGLRWRLLACQHFPWVAVLHEALSHQLRWSRFISSCSLSRCASLHAGPRPAGTSSADLAQVPTLAHTVPGPQQSAGVHGQEGKNGATDLLSTPAPSAHVLCHLGVLWHSLQTALPLLPGWPLAARAQAAHRESPQLQPHQCRTGVSSHAQVPASPRPTPTAGAAPLSHGDPELPCKSEPNPKASLKVCF